MRITKKMLKDAVKALQQRLRHLVAMCPLGSSLPDVRKEFERTFPHLPKGDHPAFDGACLNNLIQAAVNDTIPHYWYD